MNNFWMVPLLTTCSHIYQHQSKHGFHHSGKLLLMISLSHYPLMTSKSSLKLNKKGRHLPRQAVIWVHYRSLLECIQKGDYTIPDLIVSVVYISLMMASPLRRWQSASQVMIEKGKGKFVENLWIIQFVEADLNFVIHTIWGKHLI
jgi:hypothetical protein